MIKYYTAKTDGMYTAKDSKGKACGYVSKRSIQDRGELHLIVNNRSKPNA